MTMEDRYAGLVRSASALSSRGFVIQKILKAWGDWQETDERKSQQEDIGRGVENPQSLSRRFLEEHKNGRQARNALNPSRVFEIRVPSCCNPGQLIERKLLMEVI